MKFPKVIYMKSQKEDGTKYFLADPDAGTLVDMGETVKLAKYQIVEVVEGKGVAQFSSPKKR